MIHTFEEVDVSRLTLEEPVTLETGSYFSKVTYNNIPLYIHAPKCLGTENRVKHTLDLRVLDPEFATWIDNVEQALQLVTLTHCAEWFTNPVELDDIQSSFIPALTRSHSQTVLRCNSETLQVFNEDKTLIDQVIKENAILSILEIKGLKFTDKSFQLVVHGIQAMILTSPVSLFSSCLIKT